MIADRPRETLLRVWAARYPGIREPWWAHANKVAWLTSQRYIYARTVGDLQAAEAMIPIEWRRRDVRDLDPAEEAAMRARDRVRRAEWRRERRL